MVFMTDKTLLPWICGGTVPPILLAAVILLYVCICMFAEKEKLIFPKIESRITNLFKITLMNDRT